jgi:hypothetical protein
MIRLLKQRKITLNVSILIAKVLNTICLLRKILRVRKFASQSKSHCIIKKTRTILNGYFDRKNKEYGKVFVKCLLCTVNFLLGKISRINFRQT